MRLSQATSKLINREAGSFNLTGPSPTEIESRFTNSPFEHIGYQRRNLIPKVHREKMDKTWMKHKYRGTFVETEVPPSTLNISMLIMNSSVYNRLHHFLQSRSLPNYEYTHFLYLQGSVPTCTVLCVLCLQEHASVLYNYLIHLVWNYGFWVYMFELTSHIQLHGSPYQLEAIAAWGGWGLLLLCPIWSIYHTDMTTATHYS